ncbi:MAG: hypothetical protein A2039_04070 [Candidatus Melainabacteria bacterium GWA2_34_9]|nr:MAG: hypothetical protein A2039_04070 [Candidatus Melainabacteria bacterium GWA2_34_9]
MHSKNKAFTLMEMLIAMTVISILMVASVPLITQMSKMKTGTDKNVTDCINQNTSTGWYNTDGAGATILPPVGTSCYGAVIDITYNRDSAYNPTYWMVVNGATAQKTMAKQILRAACDQGGTKACDYFINECRLNGSTSSPYCNVTGETDISYYLHLYHHNYENKGATYIVEQLTDILPAMPTKLLNEVFYAKTVAPYANDNLAYDVAQPSVYIQACNNGNIEGCKKAFTLFYNRGCYQIKTNWPNAPSQEYKITYNGTTGASDTKYCNMNSLATAGITGCQVMTASQWAQTSYNDCYYAWRDSFNRTCRTLYSFWPEAPDGTYNLTPNGATAATIVPTACPISSTDCLVQGPGAVCADGTVYAGDYNGYHYYTTPSDQGMYYWGTPPNNTFTNVVSVDNGSGNTAILHNLSDPPDTWAPYNAAEACYNANDSGYSDWYLPATNELIALYAKKLVVGNFTTNAYWTSTEANATSVIAKSFNDGYATSYNKWESRPVRCLRKQFVVDPTCPLSGDTCADGTKYVGPYLTYYLFTTPLDKGSFTWNDGTAIGTTTGFTDQTYGMNNYTGLIALSDQLAPYEAALACKPLNDTSTYGYNDWYLPARYELNLIGTNAVAIGNFGAGSYWSSTEFSTTNAYYYSVSGRYDGSYGKTIAANYVRCVRRNL